MKYTKVDTCIPSLHDSTQPGSSDPLVLASHSAVVTLSLLVWSSFFVALSLMFLRFLLASRMYDFARGHPNQSLLPVKELQQLMAKASVAASESFLRKSLRYGDEEGQPEFLQELAAFQERHTQDDDLGFTTTGSKFDNHLFATEGVSHGIELLCATQTQPGDVVLVERPTYFLVSNIFHSHGLKVMSLPMKNALGGVDVDRLTKALDSGKMAPPKMIYIIPVNQNPTAYTMSITDRHALAALAVKHNIMVVADEVYHLLDWRDSLTGARKPARMAEVGRCYESSNGDSQAGCCISVSAFTKIFAPGIRCGWIEGPEHIIKSLKTYGYIRSQGGCSPVVGELMRSALSDGIADQILTKLTNAYCTRSQKLCQGLSVDPRILIANQPLGGYFVWLRFPPEIGCTSELLRFCDGKVKFLPGLRCDPFHGDNFADGEASGLKPDEFSLFARFCFADVDETVIDDGVSLFLDCFQQFLKERSDAKISQPS